MQIAISEGSTAINASHCPLLKAFCTHSLAVSALGYGSGSLVRFLSAFCRYRSQARVPQLPTFLFAYALYILLSDDPNSPDRCAVIMGTRDQIYKATELITELVHKSCNGGGAAGGGGPSATEVFYMHVPSNKTGLVIGKGGETIKQVFLKF